MPRTALEEAEEEAAMAIGEDRTRPGWYVVQVTSGEEERMCRAIERACEELDATAGDGGPIVGLAECFSPRFSSRKKRMGKWHTVERALMPGYVIADVRDPYGLTRALRRISAFCRVLSSDDTYSPLDEAERKWIEAQSEKGGRTIPLSFGYRDWEKRGTLVVTSGPLKGYEATVTGIDRKNCIAHVEFHAGPMTFKTSVGLVVQPKGRAKANAD